MKVTLDCLYDHPEKSIELLEHLYQISLRQGTLFELNIGDCSYAFPRGTKREYRMKRFCEIIRKHKPP